MNCPKCQSGNVYFQDGEYACMMCGKRWPAALQKPTEIITKNITNEKPLKTEVKEMTKKGKCSNCGRENQFLVSKGLCAGCNSAARNFEPGSPEYQKALEEAKERFTNPNAKQLPRGINKKPASNLVEKPEVQKKPKSVIRKSRIPQQKDIKEILQDKRHNLMEEVTQINNLLSMIEKYEKAA